jgi:hypothetical protein
MLTSVSCTRRQIPDVKLTRLARAGNSHYQYSPVSAHGQCNTRDKVGSACSGVTLQHLVGVKETQGHKVAGETRGLVTKQI